MRVSLQQIAEGVASYAESEIIPKMGADKSAQILVTVGINALRANPKYLENVLNQGIMRTLLDVDEENMYELDGLYNAVNEALQKYGTYTVVLPPIPVLSPTEKKMKFGADDIDALRREIERSAR